MRHETEFFRNCYTNWIWSGELDSSVRSWLISQIIYETTLKLGNLFMEVCGNSNLQIEATIQKITCYLIETYVLYSCPTYHLILIWFFYFDFSHQHYSSQNLNGTMNTSSCSDSSFLASADCGSISSAGSAEAINSELEADDSQNIISQIASEKANNRKNSLSPKQVSPLR